MPRPTRYTEEIKDRICAGLVEGKPLIAIVEDDETMPTYNMVFKWLREIPEFAKDYAHARECQADRLSDEILQVSRQKPGVVVVESEFGSRTSVDSGEVAHRRLLVDSLKWTAAKMKPKKYGDLTQVQGEVAHKHYVALLPARTTNDPAEWAKQVHAERVASGEVVEDVPEVDEIPPPPGLPQRVINGG